MSKFTKTLLVSPLSDGYRWVIRDEFSYDVGELGSGDTIYVPLNFVTDFASVPRVLWWLFPKWGIYGNAAVIHDWLYWDQYKKRKTSDDIFLEAMEVLGVPKWKRYLLYQSVRIFGWFAWNSNKKDRNKNGTESKMVSFDEFPFCYLKGEKNE